MSHHPQLDADLIARDTTARIEALEGEAMLLRRSLGQRQEQLEAADARAERLRVALQDVVDAYDFVIVDEYDRGWSSVSDAVVVARKALEKASGSGPASVHTQEQRPDPQAGESAPREVGHRADPHTTSPATP
jgi:hypothetical protein